MEHVGRNVIVEICTIASEFDGGGKSSSTRIPYAKEAKSWETTQLSDERNFYCAGFSMKIMWGCLSPTLMLWLLH